MLNYKIYKQIIDTVISLILLIIIFIPLLIVSILIIILDNQKPFYFQKRSGLHGKEFKIIKFQTMKNNKNIKKITKFGKFLRDTKIDELPQLFNVLFLEMSLIGPRPLYIDFNYYYSNFHSERLNVKPGITGISQIRIKNPNLWKKKFDYDVFYTRKISLIFDIYIFYKTIEILLTNMINSKNVYYTDQLNPYESFMKDYVKNES